MAENYQNLAASLTTGSINNSSDPVTFSVTGGTGSLFPSSNFRVVVSDSDGTNAEVMLCTSRSTDALTCARAANATNEVPTPTKLTHASGSIVQHVVTSGAMQTLLTERQYPYIAPTGFTLHDGIGGASLIADAYGATLNVPDSGGNNVIYANIALPGNQYTATFGFRGLPGAANFSQIGVEVDDGTKLLTWRFTNVPDQDIYYWSTFNNPSASQSGNSFRFWGQDVIICRIVQDASKRTFYLGDSRLRAFTQVFQQNANTNLTETNAGFFALSSNGLGAICELVHYTAV